MIVTVIVVVAEATSTRIDDKINVYRKAKVQKNERKMNLQILKSIERNTSIPADSNEVRHGRGVRGAVVHNIFKVINSWLLS